MKRVIGDKSLENSRKLMKHDEILRNTLEQENSRKCVFGWFAPILINNEISAVIKKNFIYFIFLSNSALREFIQSGTCWYDPINHNGFL